MARLGKGEANGACSLLHAAGLGYGASLALDLPVTVALLDQPARRQLSDSDGLLDQVISAWKEAGYATPGDELHWSVSSSIPPRQGLKSSAAVAVAALRALADSTSLQLSNSEIVDMAAKAQLAAGVSLTGSVDDAWAAAEGGWKLVDPNLPAAEGVILQGQGPDADDWDVLILVRDERSELPDLETFAWHQQGFQQALSALEEGNELVAVTWNGRSMVSVLNDMIGRRLTNDAFVNGARASGITGSGPAIVIFSPAVSKPTLDRLKMWYTGRQKISEVIVTKVINAELPQSNEAV